MSWNWLVSNSTDDLDAWLSTDLFPVIPSEQNESFKTLEEYPSTSANKGLTDLIADQQLFAETQELCNVLNIEPQLSLVSHSPCISHSLSNTTNMDPLISSSHQQIRVSQSNPQICWSQSQNLTSMIEIGSQETHDSSSNPTKRQRNTAASARFRARKKMKDQALQQTAQELMERVQGLEKLVKSQQSEIKRLRSLLVDKHVQLIP